MSEQQESSAANGAAGPETIADGNERRLDVRSVTVQRLSGGIGAAILSLAVLIGVVSVMFATSNTMVQGLLLLAGWFLISALAAAAALLWPPVRHRHISYRLDEKGIQIRGGVLWKSTVNVPHSRVQHTDVQQGPIERAFELATLIIHTAGTQHASIPLSGLSHGTAMRIRDYLLEEEEQAPDA